MVRDYELMYIVRPDVDDDGLRVAVDSVKSLIEGQGGEVAKTTMWGKRRLAYEVKHLRDGHYVIVEMRLDGSKVAVVERALRIHDAVFRHLLVVQEAPGVEGELEGAVQVDGESAPASEDSPSVAANGDRREPKDDETEPATAAVALDAGESGEDEAEPATAAATQSDGDDEEEE